ncbi:MAG: hypothetical protein MR546_10075 [Oscillospiraceae bacterium]|nr:hypothetical protein [Oscillospiraceae bacterium]
MSDKFVPLEKMSKKDRREFYSKRRRDWNGLNPVTRTADGHKKYNRARKKAELLRTEL